MKLPPIRVTDVMVDWMEGWGNSPNWHVVLSRAPEPEEFDGRWEQLGPCYRAQVDPLVQFLFWERPGEGFGGRVYDLKMMDGSTRSLKGPWSSRSAIINQVFADRPPCIEMAYVTEDELKGTSIGENQVYCWMSGNVLTEHLAAFLIERRFVVAQRVSADPAHGVNAPRKVIHGKIRVAWLTSKDGSESYFRPMYLSGPKNAEDTITKEVL